MLIFSPEKVGVGKIEHADLTYGAPAIQATQRRLPLAFKGWNPFALSCTQKAKHVALSHF